MNRKHHWDVLLHRKLWHEEEESDTEKSAEEFKPGT